MPTTELNLEDEVLGRIDKLAEAMHRDRVWIMNKAIQRYLDSEEWFVNSAPQAAQPATEDR